eukprot:TRINITY_DN13155_c0_g1_i1.p1 TRINITY_DN13155_c0_g1~~TRINITY_DN13155_c0_g1_i1.p1  ORF type:complete len:125 (+),score=31.91 TRINITY_DN13155_c0_g1_i1:81-455(+)
MSDSEKEESKSESSDRASFFTTNNNKRSKPDVNPTIGRSRVMTVTSSSSPTFLPVPISAAVQIVKADSDEKRSPVGISIGSPLVLSPLGETPPSFPSYLSQSPSPASPLQNPPLSFSPTSPTSK